MLEDLFQKTKLFVRRVGDRGTESERSLLPKRAEIIVGDCMDPRSMYWNPTFLECTQKELLPFSGS